MSYSKSAKPIKVCHITSVHSRYDNRILEKECKSLARNGYNVSLVVNDSQENEINDNVKIISTKHEYKNRIERLFTSRKHLYKKAIEIDADIYHFHDPELLPLGNKLKRMGKKVIFDAHENYTLQIKEKGYIPKIFRHLISKLYHFYETYSSRKIDAVIFPCTFNGINPFENRAKRTTFINNVPILSELYDKFDSDAPKGNGTICYVGSLTYSRGITHLIKASNKADAKLILGGCFSPAEYSKEVEVMDEYSSVDFRGYVNRNEVVDIYKMSSIGASNILNIGQYNKTDNFATKVYEYMSMGLPVIVSDYQYARKVLKEYEFGIAVDPENVDEIAQAINYLLCNPEVSEKMGQEGRRAVKERFNWSIEEEKLLALYDCLIND